LGSVGAFRICCSKARSGFAAVSCPEPVPPLGFWPSVQANRKATNSRGWNFDMMGTKEKEGPGKHSEPGPSKSSG